MFAAVMQRAPHDHGVWGIILAVFLATTAPGTEVRSAERVPIPRAALVPRDDSVLPPQGQLRGRGRGGNDWQTRRIFYPPDLPPLGAQINFDGRNTVPSHAPGRLASVISEPFYAPWSTCLVDLREVVQRKYNPRVAAYVESREALLAELRETLAAVGSLSLDERYATLAALAERQARALAKLEAEAETLREELAAKSSWYDLREWKLGRSSLSERLPEHRILEFQLVRAAAYYQEGLLPAQRRLLREAAMLMQDEMFARELGTAEPPPPLMFFSPDLVRLLPSGGYPEAVATRLVDFVAEKDALRQELVDTVIEQDKVKFWSVRRRELETLARAQAPRLAALEARAEEIRREFAPTLASKRRAPPPSLPADLSALIDACLEDQKRLQNGFDRHRGAVRARVIAESQGQTFGEVRAKIADQTVLEAERYVRENAAAIEKVERMLDQIHPRLFPLATADGFVGAQTGVRFVFDYMRHRREAAGYHEYEVAVWEPGLSPAQRQLLLGGALRRFELPLPGPERQPSRLPATLLDPTAE